MVCFLEVLSLHLTVSRQFRTHLMAALQHWDSARKQLQKEKASKKIWKKAAEHVLNTNIGKRVIDQDTTWVFGDFF